MRLWRAVEAVAVGVWIGAMTGFSIVAPILFQTLPDAQAGAIAGTAIQRIDWLGVVLGVVAVVALSRRLGGRPLRWLRLLVFLGMIALAVGNETYVRGRMEAVRPYMSASADDPLRREFDRWHRTSVMLWGINMLAGAVALGWTAAEAGEEERRGPRAEAGTRAAGTAVAGGEPAGPGLGPGGAGGAAPGGGRL